MRSISWFTFLVAGAAAALMLVTMPASQGVDATPLASSSTPMPSLPLPGITELLETARSLLHRTIGTETASAVVTLSACTPPPGPLEKGVSCGGGTSSPPHSLGPSFCALCCTGQDVVCDDGTLPGCCNGYCQRTGCDRRDPDTGACVDWHEVPVCPAYSCRQQCENKFGVGTPYLWDSSTGECGCEPPSSLPPPGTTGGTCSDTDHDGTYDSCLADGESNIPCNTDADCTRTRHTTCGGAQGKQCLVEQGPGINQCGPAGNPDDALCACQYVPPNRDTCGGQYDLSANSLVSCVGNFGDPLCNFTGSGLENRLLQVEEPRFLQCWLEIRACEGGPVSVNPASTSGSAWGMFQMGHDAWPSCGIGRQMNNEFDRGDVPWCLQASNAVYYSKNLCRIGINKFWYWGCYRNASATPSCSVFGPRTESNTTMC